MKMVPKKVALSKTSRSLGTCREQKPLDGSRYCCPRQSCSPGSTSCLPPGASPLPGPCPAVTLAAHLLPLKLYGQDARLEVGVHGRVEEVLGEGDIDHALGLLDHRLHRVVLQLLALPRTVEEHALGREQQRFLQP